MTLSTVSGVMTVGLAVLIAQSAAGADAAARCEAAKLKVSGKYAYCRLRAEASAMKTGGAPDYSKCDAKLSQNFGAAESAAGGNCPTEGDVAAMQDLLTGDADFARLRLDGVRFIDNGDGTVTDTSTGLMWEKKDDGGGLHDKDNTYSWFDAMSQFVSEVNGFNLDGGAVTQTGLGGFSDWRLPTAAELRTILITTAPPLCAVHPCIDPIFGPTLAGYYWTSTTVTDLPDDSATIIGFEFGDVGKDDKTNTGILVRAVRRAE